MSSPINIRLAKKDDYAFIAQAFDEWYYPQEPLSIGCRIKTPSPIEKQFFNSAPDDGLTLVATLPEEGEKIVGFLVNLPGNRKLRNSQVKEEKMDERCAAFIDFAKAMESQQDILETFEGNKIFKIVALAVDPAVRGRNIGYKLFEFAFMMAKQLGYHIVRTVCSSKFSTIIAERLHMVPVASIEYKEYKDSEGYQIFTPSPEHTHATLFVKLLT